MKVQYDIECRKSDTPDQWDKLYNGSNSSLKAVEKTLREILERQKENGHLNFKEFGKTILEYRIVRVTTSTESTVLSNHPVVYKTYNKDKSEELHFLKQIYKNLKYLEHLYRKNEDYRQLAYIGLSLSNTQYQIDELEKEVAVDYSDTWRTFDQS
jgi:hypothetical protein